MNPPAVATLTSNNDGKVVIVRMTAVVWAKGFTKPGSTEGTTLMLSNGTTLEVREGLQRITLLLSRGG